MHQVTSSDALVEDALHGAHGASRDAEQAITIHYSLCHETNEIIALDVQLFVVRKIYK